MLGSTIIDKLTSGNAVSDIVDEVKSAVDYTEEVESAIKRIQSGEAFSKVSASMPYSLAKPLEDYINNTDRAKLSAEEFAKSNESAMKSVESTTVQATQSVSKFSTVLKSIGAGLLDVGIGIAVGAAITGIIKGLDALILTADEAKEAMDSAFSDYDDAKNQVADVENELASTNDQITALLQKGRLTFVEESELAKLQQQRKELETILDIAEKLEGIKAKEAGDAAVENYKTQFDGGRVSQDSVNEKLSDSTYTPNGLLQDENNLSAQLASIKYYTQEKNKAFDSELIQQYQDNIDTATENIWKQVGSLEKIRSNLSSIPEDMRTAEQNDVLK